MVVLCFAPVNAKCSVSPPRRAGVQEEADRGAAAGGAAAEAAAAGAGVPGVAAAAAAAGPGAPAAGQEAAVPLQGPGARRQRQAGLDQGGKAGGTQTPRHRSRSLRDVTGGEGGGFSRRFALGRDFEVSALRVQEIVRI